MILQSEQPKILVVGSSSIDLVLNTLHHPQPGETVMAHKSESFFGGKGANQAVGAARLGASVYFIGSVGQDPLGQQVLRNLVSENVNVGYVYESENSATGTAYVTAADGKNSIVVVPAANQDLAPEHLQQADKIFAQKDLVLLQLEIPMKTVEYAVQMAKNHGKKVGIYAAPAKKLSPEVLDYASFIVAKSNELPLIFGNEARESVLKKYANKLFVRDDTNSTIYHSGSELRYFRNDPELTAHKMGMGDAFTSGFAVAFCHGNSIDDCVSFGNRVSLCVAENRGSQSGLPYLSDLISEVI